MVHPGSERILGTPLHYMNRGVNAYWVHPCIMWLGVWTHTVLELHGYIPALLDWDVNASLTPLDYLTGGCEPLLGTPLDYLSGGSEHLLGTPLDYLTGDVNAYLTPLNYMTGGGGWTPTGYTPGLLDWGGVNPYWVHPCITWLRRCVCTTYIPGKWSVSTIWPCLPCQ